MHGLMFPAAESPVCVVTGASRGIGKSIALALGAAGARVSAMQTCVRNYNSLYSSVAVAH